MNLISNQQNINIDKWQLLCSQSDYTSPFQTFDFYKFYNSVPGISAEVFATEENDAYTSLVVVTIQKENGIKGYFSKRGIIYGGPVLLGKPESLDFLLRGIIKHYKSQLIYLEIRNFLDYASFSDIFQKTDWRFIPYLNSTIDIGNRQLPELLKNMKYNRRREIKISLEQNVVYRECQSEQELNDLYKILVELYATRVKLPIPDEIFFKQLWKSPVGKVFIVEHNSKIIGGSFCVFLNEHSIYTMYYCGLRDYDKKIFPTHLAVLAALDYACKFNCKLLDFMGAGLKGEEYGVRSYKQEFGGKLNEYGRYRILLNPILFKVGELGIRILKKIN